MFGNSAQLPSPTGQYAGLGQSSGGFSDAFKKLGLGGAMGAGGSLGGLIGGLFSNSSQPYDTYSKYLQQAMDSMKQHEATGRGDLSSYYQKALGLGEPYRNAGSQGLQTLLGTLGLGGPGSQQSALDKFRTSPGYQFAVNQGLQGVQRGMSAHGLGGSGAEMRALQGTGQGLADQQFGQYQQRLAGLAGMGQQEAGRAEQMAYGTGGELSRLGSQYAGPMSNLLQSMGATQAAQQYQQGQVPGQIGSTLGSLAGMAMFM